MTLQTLQATQDAQATSTALVTQSLATHRNTLQIFITSNVIPFRPYTYSTAPTTLITYRLRGEEYVRYMEVESADIAKVFMHNFCDTYEFSSSIFTPDNGKQTAPKPYYISEVTEDQIAANKQRVQNELKRKAEHNNYKRIFADSIRDQRKYHIKSLDQHTIVSCPVTGICFEVSMPSIPVFLQQHHPLANTGNVLKTLEWFFETSEVPDRISELDTSVLAGILLVLLRMKHILIEQETSALAENALLQHIPRGTLCHYIKSIWHGKEQNKVWQNMPKLRLNAEGQSVLATLESWFKTLNAHFIGKTIDTDTAAKLFESTRNKSPAQKTLRIYSAEVSQHKKLNGSKEAAQFLYKQLASSMNPTLRVLVKRTIANLIVITAGQKETLSEAISHQFITHPTLKDKAKQLIDVLSGVHTEHIAQGLERVSDLFGNDSVTTTPKRSMAEILAAKAAQRNVQ